MIIPARSWQTVTALGAATLLLGAAPAHADGGALQAAGLVIAGPLVLFLCLGSIALVYLIAAAFRRQEWLVGVAQAGAAEADRGRVVSTLWGVIAEILLISAGLILTKIPPAGLLVIVILLLIFTLAGMGACVAAAVMGRRMHLDLAGGDVSPLTSLGVGLLLLFAAAAVPFIGWCVVLLLMANGVGSILSASMSRSRG